MGARFVDLSTSVHEDTVTFPRDVVIHTSAGTYRNEERFLTDHGRLRGEASAWLVEPGVQAGFPVTWVETTAAPVRAVAIIED